MAKDRKNQRSAAKALLYLDDSDYYVLEDDHYADDYYEESLYEEDVYEEYLPQKTPLTVNLLSVQTRCSQSKKAKTKNTSGSSDPAKEAEKEDDPLAYLVNMKPRLVRSKSFTSERPRASHRRPSFTGFEATSTATALPAVQCIQSLIPARSSVVGPTPRASLTISSSKYHSAVLLTWSLHCPEPRVLPLVGWRNLQVAEKIQTKLRRRLASDLEADDWQTYLNMSTALYERHEEWVTLLEDTIGDSPTQAHQRWKYLSQSCMKATMTLGECYSHYEMLQNLEQKVNAPSERVLPEKVDNSHVCLVCFEELEAGAACQLLACGHSTCMDCSKAYLKSAAASGQGSIKCSAYKCDVSVNIFDAAHILNEEDDHETWERLVFFALERGEAPPGARFCPTRNCGRLVKPTNSGSSSQHPGFNVLMCDCGTSRCRDCNYEAHPGVTCSDYKMLRRAIDSGKLDAELANVKWVIKHSRPCPKCQYPIEKDGGCNHVRCQRCLYYFCFQCGGEGQLCMAYHCKNTNKYWHEDTNYDEGHYGAMSNLVGKYRAYRSTRCKLSTLVNSLAASCDDGQELPLDDDKPEVLLEIQCLQALLWVHVASISRIMSNSGESNNNSNNLRQKKAALSLELVLHSLSLRNLKQQQQQTNKIKPTAQEAVTLGLPPPKRLSHCKQLAKDRQQQPGGGGLESFQEIFVDQELQDLFGADSARFAKKARDAIQEGIQSLCPPPSPAKKSRRRRRSVVEEGPLNQKMERPKNPWRNGYKNNTSSADDEDCWLDDGNRSMKRCDRRWKKNKARVRARRDASLGLNGL